MSSATPELSPRRELWLLLTLAGIQFTHILDFMIMMPLGPQLTQLFAITDAQFGLLVSAYTLSAGASGLLASTYIDRFGRKRLLLVLNIGIAELDDPRGLCRDISNIGRWGNGDVEVGLSSLDELPYVMGLIRQALDRQMGGPQDDEY